MEKAFTKFPSLEVVADGVDSHYKVRFIECVLERGTIRFETRKGTASKDDIERLVEELVAKVRVDGR